MGKSLVVKSAVRSHVKGMRVSGDFFIALDKAVAYKIEKAIVRAKSNGRKTLRPADV